MRTLALIALCAACAPVEGVVVPLDGDVGPSDLDGDGIPDVDDDDIDGDGFAEPEDCDDRDASVNPEAEEICGNGIDDDCDGTANACSLPEELDVATEARGTWFGEVDGDQLGVRVRMSPDLDDDGFADALVAAGNVGVAYRISGFEGEPRRVNRASTTWTSTSTDFARTLDGGTDVTGDGQIDIVLPEPSYSTEVRGAVGRVFVLPADSQVRPTTRRATIDGVFAFAGLGQHVYSHADTDGDGQAELWAQDATGWRLFDVRDGGRTTTSFAQATLPRGELAAADVDGDGLDEILIADVADRRQPIQVYAGPFDGTYTASRAVAQTERAEFNSFTFAFDAGDLDGDGYADIVTARNPYGDVTVGTVAIYAGSAELDLARTTRISGLSGGGNQLTAAVRARRDLDGDGDADLAFSVNNDVLVFLDPEEGDLAFDAADSRLIGPGSRDLRVGDLDVAPVPNVDGTRTLGLTYPDRSGGGVLYLLALPGI